MAASSCLQPACDPRPVLEKLAQEPWSESAEGARSTALAREGARVVWTSAPALDLLPLPVTVPVPEFARSAGAPPALALPAVTRSPALE